MCVAASECPMIDGHDSGDGMARVTNSQAAARPSNVHKKQL
jgi:hypothetical protein